VLADLVTDESDVNVTLFSSLNKSGVGDVAEVLHGWAASPEVAEALAAAQAAQAAAEATPEHWDDKDEGDASAASPHDQA
jgi:GTP-binding protein